ncbi:type II toxin-antitoxin system prevent-host-death family antitoxin [Thiomicrospira microaerophila]|uniref:type II toxin-antitoxin system Phd/YefM family antitoxin n=1 Tax=Thiomicrospira microaerophila TaxID=406020 RepID=UPI00201099DD|nr:type II toxin-antitoxin system prevent-host-death family antitoxin [Thiomicrospira microaerophila]UQB41252.1 type II toxin-antitoxin system prevent-host-death family antitoxin [Thiomicrospira microaerophila]
MQAVTYSWARNHLAESINQVCDNHEAMVITKKNDRAAVLMSLEDYQALEETAYLLRSPKNAKRLMDSIHELENGQGQARTLVECD